jgi:hypothetical protein
MPARTAPRNNIAARGKATKWATLKKQAAQRTKGHERPKVEPYIIDDVEPPIIIEPPDDKRLLIIAECLGPDLQFVLQVNFLDFFDGTRPWRQLYVFLERLPYWGHYKTALVMDEDWAKQILEREIAGEEVASAANPDEISPLGYTPEIAYLALIADRVDLVNNTLIAVNSDGGAPMFSPLPRPTTLLDRMREQRTIDELLELDRQIRGG